MSQNVADKTGVAEARSRETRSPLAGVSGETEETIAAQQKRERSCLQDTELISHPWPELDARMMVTSDMAGDSLNLTPSLSNHWVHPIESTLGSCQGLSDFVGREGEEAAGPPALWPQRSPGALLLQLLTSDHLFLIMSFPYPR